MSDAIYTIETLRCTVRNGFASVVQAGKTHLGSAYYSSQTTQGDPFEILYLFNANLIRDYGFLKTPPKVTARNVDPHGSFFQATLAFDNGVVAQHEAQDVHLAQALALRSGFEMALKL